MISLLKPLGLTLLFPVILSACSYQYPSQNIVGESLPSFSGESLNKEIVQIPQDLNQQIAILLFGFVQDTQFDLDRWMIGFEQTRIDVPYYEIPTIEGFLPGLFRSRIDQGMRNGIPKALWNNVVTVYQDSHIIRQFLGTENERNGRIVLLDEQGVVRFFHDEGFSVGALTQLREQILMLQTKPKDLASTTPNSRTAFQATNNM